MTTLPDHHLRLAVADCIRDTQPERRTLATMIARLPRETETSVVAAYDAAMFGDIERDTPTGKSHGRLAERMRELHRPLALIDREGVTLSTMAAQCNMDRDTLVSLLDHHGYLELAPYGGRQRRYLLTDAAINARLGHNVDPSGQRSRRLDGMRRTAPFAVFYAEALSTILWTLDWLGVSRSISGLPTKRRRVEFALRHHGHLPNGALASLCGCSLSGVEKARGRGSSGVVSGYLTHDRTLRPHGIRPIAADLGEDSLRRVALRICRRTGAGLSLVA